MPAGETPALLRTDLVALSRCAQLTRIESERARFGILGTPRRLNFEVLLTPLEAPDRALRRTRTMSRTPLLLTLLFATTLFAAAPEKQTLYVQVILGCDQDRPANPAHKEIGPKLAAKLSPVFRWKHYWETERRKVEFDPAKVTRLTLAEDRTLEIERLKTGEFEVRLFRKSGLLTKARQPGRGGMAILGGEQPSKDSFFVVVRTDEPVNRE